MGKANSELGQDFASIRSMWSSCDYEWVYIYNNDVKDDSKANQGFSLEMWGSHKEIVTYPMKIRPLWEDWQKTVAGFRVYCRLLRLSPQTQGYSTVYAYICTHRIFTWLRPPFLVIICQLSALVAMNQPHPLWGPRKWHDGSLSWSMEYQATPLVALRWAARFVFWGRK